MDHSSIDMPAFLDMPNKMNPGTWVLLGVVLTAILSGFLYLFLRWWKSRVPWKKLSDHFPEAMYFGKGHEPDTKLLVLCLHQTIQLLSKHSILAAGPGGLIKWSPSVVAMALKNVRIYVMDTDKWVDEWGRKVAGIQAGRALFIGRDLAAFLHECAHRCEEMIDKERDMAHATWVADGIRAAEDEFGAWLATQRKP